ncbi:efflux RND transporter permease subunit [Candidatus Latescibacterota bacterium]
MASSIPDEFTARAIKIDTENLSNMFMTLEVRGSGGVERLRSIIDNTITKEFENVDGIAHVETTGGQVKSIEIILNEQASSAYGITPATIQSLISRNTRMKTFVGHAYESDRHYFVNLVADYIDIRNIENIVVDPDGPIMLNDIATIYFGVKKEDSISRVNGMDAVTMRLIRDANVNLIELSHITQEVVNRLNRDLKYQDIEIVIQTDTAEEMENNINLIINLAVIGGLLAVIILWFFLRNVRLVAMVFLVIPISIFTAFNFFYAFDISINSLTLVGMALAVGMLLDNSVVVLENIYRHVSLNKDRDTAVILGTKEVWRSIFAATLTTITVFVPFVFSSEYLIRMIGRHIGVSIISTLLVSLVAALMLIPMIAHTLLRNPGKKSGLFAKVSQKNRLLQIYTFLVKFSTRFPARTIIGVVIIFFISLAVCLSLSLDVPRELDLKEFPLYVTMPRGSTLERTDSVVAKLEEELADIEEKKDVICTIYDEEAFITIILEDDYESINNRTITQIKQDIQDRISSFREADVSLSEPQSSSRFGGGSGTDPVASLQRLFGIGQQRERVVIKGSDFELLRKVADDIQYYIEELETIQGTGINIPNNQPEIHLLFDNELMTRNNISLNAVVSELGGFANEFSTGTTFKQGSDEYEIIIKNDIPEEELREKTYEDLRTLNIQNEAQATFTLDQISRIIYSFGKSAIRRVNQEKQVELTYRFSPEIYDSKSFLETSRDEIDQIIASLSIPTGVAIELIYDETELTEFHFLIAAAFILIYMILASVFESLLIPLVMMFTIPLATVGSFWALIVTGNSLSNAHALIGFLILLGVVVNNGIILIDYTRILRRNGYNRSRALMMAGQARVRPILITAITTIVAMIPLAMGKAEYISRIGAPFAIAVIGGLSLSTLFTLVFIPTVYSASESAVEWFKRLDWKIKLIQLLSFSACCLIIYQYVDSLFWKGAYIIMALTAIPGLTWFIMVSLRRASAEYFTSNEKLTITIRKMVKTYDDYSRFEREWKKGERMEHMFGKRYSYGFRRIFHQYTWQLPLMGFLIYFVYYYLRSNFWLFILSHVIYFFALLILKPVLFSLLKRTEQTGKLFYRKIQTVLYKTFLWGIPLLNIGLFYMRDFRIEMLIFFTLSWYSCLIIYTASQRLHNEKLDIMRLDGKFAGLRRAFYRFVRIVPFIGKKKTPFNALNGISLNITSGMFGLLGPNGAGKTTLMRIVCGILHQSLGSIRINDINYIEKREELQGLIGYLPQEFGTYENMTAYEFLDYLALLKGIYNTKERKKRVSHVLSSVHLSESRNRQIRSFSGGMKQRIGIALTLLHLPRILVVDEPTAGLDPRERIRFRNLLVELSRERIVIFSTHIIEDISSSCNRVAVLDKGELYYLGDPQHMTDEAEGKVWQFNISEQEFYKIQKQERIVHHMRVGDSIRVRCLAESSPRPDAVHAQPTLEDAYLWLLGDKEK